MYNLGDLGLLTWIKINVLKKFLLFYSNKLLPMADYDYLYG